MRKWGILISVFYALILLALIVPGATLLALYKFEGWGKLLGIVTEAYGDWMLWLLIAAVLTSQALLLFLSVDTSQKRPQAPLPYSRFRHRRRASHRPSSSAVIWSLGFAIRGEGFWKSLFDKEVNLLFFWGALWGAVGNLLLTLFPQLLSCSHLAAQRQRPRTPDRSPLSRYRPPPSRLFRSTRNQLRHRHWHRHHAPVLRPQRPLSLQESPRLLPPAPIP